MSEIRQSLAETIEQVRNGTLPLDTAKEVHLTAHRHVMDRYADDREARRIGEEAHDKKMADANQRIAAWKKEEKK